MTVLRNLTLSALFALPVLAFGSSGMSGTLICKSVPHATPTSGSGTFVAKFQGSSSSARIVNIPDSAATQEIYGDTIACGYTTSPRVAQRPWSGLSSNTAGPVVVGVDDGGAVPGVVNNASLSVQTAAMYFSCGTWVSGKAVSEVWLDLSQCKWIAD
jgi:hypothetical protein